MISHDPASANSDDGARLTVLIADDNHDAAESLALLLDLEGHEVRTVGDGRQALTLAEAWRPRVALLDIGMPGLNGYQLAQALRATDWGQRMLLIALTGWGQSDDQAKAHDAGFDHHCTKPVDADQLLALIAQPRAG
ncbi:response regulator [Aquabacterium sp. J223]|uniref:response regulator n=1 Tax=Aquabacterium sp. J223 TaxID=2898431 RepID=UPI0021AE10F4|nr:response regulator [Aquabacterium sp. J223]UUX96121.1 response regulator [Aquabacterium sp. J223]